MARESPDLVLETFRGLSDLCVKLALSAEGQSGNDYKVFRLFGIISDIVPRKEVLEALGNKIEHALEPVLQSVTNSSFRKYTSELLLLVRKICEERKAVSQEVFTFIELFLTSVGLVHKGSLQGDKFLLLNTVLCYGRETFKQAPKAANLVRLTEKFLQKSKIFQKC